MAKVYCACGCGKQFEEVSKWHRKRRYIHGHGHSSGGFKKGHIPRSKGLKGYTNFGSFKKGQASAFKGRKHSKETKKKMSIMRLGKPSSLKGTKNPNIVGEKNPMKRLENRIKLSKIMKGRKHSEETKKKMRGRIWSKESREKLSKSLKGKYSGSKNYFYNKSFALELHPNWQGGKSFEPYTSDFNIRFKERIRERDGYTCQLCNLFEEDHLKLHKKRLTIHHIDYNKLNTFPQNCITLCTRCNLLVNKDREIWTRHFQELLKKLYNYEYTQDQKIILDFTKTENGTN